MGYRCEATTVEGFVQQVAVSYLPNGSRYYASGVVRVGKDPKLIDESIISKYQIPKNKWERYRRKKRGCVNIQYIRFERRYLILATGPVSNHPFFETEDEIRDVTEVPIRFGGYELSYRDGKVWVRIDRRELKKIHSHFYDVSVKRSVLSLTAEIRALPYEPYRGVRYQLFRLVDAINDRRKSAGLSSVPGSVVPYRRTSCLPFEPVEAEKSRVVGLRASRIQSPL
jgi:hypothetical protein